MHIWLTAKLLLVDEVILLISLVFLRTSTKKSPNFADPVSNHNYIPRGCSPDEHMALHMGVDKYFEPNECLKIFLLVTCGTWSLMSLLMIAMRAARHFTREEWSEQLSITLWLWGQGLARQCWEDTGVSVCMQAELTRKIDWSLTSLGYFHNLWASMYERDSREWWICQGIDRNSKGQRITTVIVHEQAWWLSSWVHRTRYCTDIWIPSNRGLVHGKQGGKIFELLSVWGETIILAWVRDWSM